MQAAVVSVLLMAGVCGAPQCPCDGAHSPMVAQQIFDNETNDCTVYDRSTNSGSNSERAAHPDGLWSPVTPSGTLTYDVGLFGRPRYSPLWLIHGNAKYYPANYTKPYDYREAFGYPWNGPRPLAEH